MEFKKLQSDMVAAMKARDKARKDTISSLISAVKKLAIDEGKRDDIPEELVDRATKNKGQIMKAVMAELKGKANGKDINQIVGKLCQ